MDDEEKKLRNMVVRAYNAGYDAAMRDVEKNRLRKNADILEYARRNGSCTIGMEDPMGGKAHYRYALVGYSASPYGFAIFT